MLTVSISSWFTKLEGHVSSQHLCVPDINSPFIDLGGRLERRDILRDIIRVSSQGIEIAVEVHTRRG